ncbi:11349_t:CDS:1 [Acaulospora morrowiae]|uniref:11349_t:CDS:1 n=1 Tax=Acaulospora morrowiae TaxID=94023 RepID=A0A9N8VNK6_9GLOM|nr:11349_t:CDS:1 [Acaulospora morrowiae]
MEQEGKSSETGSNSGSNSDTSVLDEVTNRFQKISTSGANDAATSPAGQTIPSSLTFDCLEEIIKNLFDNKPALFSCALVNRSWCRIAIPLLWCRPFEHRMSTRKFSEIIRTYVSLLPESSRRLLNTRVIRLPSKPLLFNYPKYLRSFDVSNFQDGLYFLLCSSVQLNLNTVQKYVQVLGNFLFGQTEGLKLLKIDDPLNSHILIDISEFEDVYMKLRFLESIEFNLNRMNIKNESKRFQKFCNTLSKHAYYLKQIAIDYNLQIKCTEQLYSISKLIEAQRNLESVTTMEFWVFNNKKIIYDILKTQSHSLRYLCINGVANVDKLLELIKVCKELGVLEIFGFQDFSPRFTTDSSSSNCSDKADINISHSNDNHDNNSDVSPKIHQIKLGRLSCNDVFSSVSTSYSPTMSLIIRMSNVYLQELLLSDLTMELMECIQQQCPNLKKFCASMIFSLCPSFFPVLKGMKKLEYLYLQTRHDEMFYHRKRLQISDNKDEIKEFVKSLPLTLLHLELDFKINADGLVILFDECNVGLCTFVLHNYFLDEKVVRSVVKYARRVGTLRKFRYGRTWNEGTLWNIMGDVMNEAREVIGNVGPI